MRRVALVLLAVPALCLVSLPAWAQERDPFRPPPAVSPAGDDRPAPRPGGPGDLSGGPPPEALLPRSGPDVQTPLAVAALFLAIGGATLATGRALAS